MPNEPSYTPPGTFDGDPQEVEEQALAQLKGHTRSLANLVEESYIQLRSSELSRLLRASPELEPAALRVAYDEGDRSGELERVRALMEALRDRVEEL